ncbi:MAG: hypothetical protein E7575_01290 [Ruminococcaceae bacterium]|nr:hypothetical protein [Oscillospiraceae bacterium]
MLSDFASQTNCHTAIQSLQESLVKALKDGTPPPKIYTDDRLGDYEYSFENFETATDIKTKVLFLSSNPKGYNVDKLLEFLAKEKTVYLVFIVAVDKDKNITTRLCSMFNKQLLNGTGIISHWAGRNSRGVTQYMGKALEEIVDSFDEKIDFEKCREFLDKCLSDAN